MCFFSGFEMVSWSVQGTLDATRTRKVSAIMEIFVAIRLLMAETRKGSNTAD